jgi:hypothetical protein
MKATRARDERIPGIPGDAYLVEKRGHQFFVVNARNHGVFGGPFHTREEAQRVADDLNVTLGRSHARR